MSLLFCAAVSVTACGGGTDSAPALTPMPAPPPSTSPPPSVSAAWAAVDRDAAAAFASSGVQGMTVSVFDRNDVKVFEKSYGNFAPTQRVAVGSASKLVAGTVMFRLIGQGFLSLDSTSAQVLGWSGARGAITLRHLLSFTSGLVPEPACINNPFITLAACVDQVRDDPAAVVAAPGTRSMRSSYARRSASAPSQRSTHSPEQRIARLNPRVAGDLTASLDEYARILALSFHRGTYQGVTYAPASLFDQRAIAPYPSAAIGLSPFANLGLEIRYGLAARLECSTLATGCSVISSPGAFGWTPWLDRQAGYCRGDWHARKFASRSGVVAFSVNLAQSLKPDMVRALGAP